MKRGDGYVEERATVDGVPRYRARWREPQPDGRDAWRSKSFHTSDDAEDHLRTVGRAKRDGRYTPESRITVADAVAEYIERGRDRWTANTIASYGQVARSHITPHIGTLRVATLTTSQVQGWIDTLARKQLAPSTIRNARIVLAGTCGDLVRLGVLVRNPVTGVRVPSRKRTTQQVWNEHQVRAVIAVASRTAPVMAVYYRVALTTAMRPGEIRALMWRDIDFEAGTITCQRTVTRDEQFRQVVGTATKTDRARVIAVPASTIAALRELRTGQLARRLAAERWAPTDLVFDRGDGNMVAQQTLRNWHEGICRAADVPQIRMHDTRHTAATMMLKAGVNVKVVSEVLGHRNITTTLDIYTHVSVDMQRTATDLLGEIADG